LRRLVFRRQAWEKAANVGNLAVNAEMSPCRPSLALGKAIFQYRLLTGLVCLIVLFFWSSTLSFFPVPWPDDAAFFLTGIEWANWPPLYRMHAQAPFVPSYDVANFNIMPGLPLMLGLGNLAGINGSHGIHVFGMVALALWATLLALWMARRKLGRRWIWLITLGALFAPVVRWGAMVVRTEVWQGLLWLLMLMELDGSLRVGPGPCQGGRFPVQSVSLLWPNRTHKRRGVGCQNCAV
jgi:hypothetical protein